MNLYRILYRVSFVISEESLQLDTERPEVSL